MNAEERIRQLEKALYEREQDKRIVDWLENNAKAVWKVGAEVECSFTLKSHEPFTKPPTFREAVTKAMNGPIRV